MRHFAWFSKVHWCPQFERQPDTDQWHGGVIASLVDITGCYALMLVAKGPMLTLNFSTDFLRLAERTDLIATARVTPCRPGQQVSSMSMLTMITADSLRSGVPATRSGRRKQIRQRTLSGGNPHDGPDQAQSALWVALAPLAQAWRLRWARAGHSHYDRIARCRARRRDRPGAVGKKAGAPISGTDNAAAAASAAIVAMTVPYANHTATLDTIRPHLDGKILIDVTVPLVPPKGTHRATARGRSPRQRRRRIRSAKASRWCRRSRTWQPPTLPISTTESIVDVLVCGQRSGSTSACGSTRRGCRHDCLARGAHCQFNGPPKR